MLKKKAYSHKYTHWKEDEMLSRFPNVIIFPEFTRRLFYALFISHPYQPNIIPEPRPLKVFKKFRTFSLGIRFFCTLSGRAETANPSITLSPPLLDDGSPLKSELPKKYEISPLICTRTPTEL